MKVYLCAVEHHTGHLAWLEEHHSLLHALRRFRKLKWQFELRSARLALYVQRGDA